ncbi:UDP-glucose 4-epimerase GalE [Desulfogranum marinum]|uniref:UDP-glucose 4-epimerase GalE n=1 Tax=Desulfogranum marinum TaxID=453220 RepID=UPI001962DA62|nr:UDP-glucose 4-epimerase GalE [Desulfogranum marinum]MBM9512998.1 UDP-glucose 4-epimerase GalE [Desulfogranum marinum]
MNNSILVTGGAGYIGSHTCKVLKGNGYLPVTYDNLVYGHKEAVKWGPFEEGDILDSDRLREVFEQYKPSAVIHFAAFGYVGESVVDPGKYYTNNVAGTVNLLELMRSVGCEKIVFSSTCATFGIPDALPLTEASPQRPINPYGWSKLMIEQILADYDTAYGLKHVALRYFNAAGADLDGETGENHTPETHLIPLVLEAALGKREKIVVYGNDYQTSDGTAIRDYVHVMDLADAHVKSLELLAATGTSDQFNLGSETGTSVKEIIDITASVSDTRVPFEYGPRRDGDPPLLVANAEKAKRILLWKPRFSETSTIIQSAYDWHKRQ